MDAIEAPAARPAFVGRPGALPPNSEAGVTITAVAGAGIAAVQARKGMALTVALREFTLIPTAPNAWLAIAGSASPEFSDQVAAAMGPGFSVCDQSGAYGFLRLWGPRARALLMKGVFLDLDAAAFPPGAAASTSLAHIGVVLWREPGADAFGLLCYRSYAPSLWDWLVAEAAEYGLTRAL